MKLVIFLLYNDLFIYQVLCTLIYRRRSLNSFLWEHALLFRQGSKVEQSDYLGFFNVINIFDIKNENIAM